MVKVAFDHNFILNNRRSIYIEMNRLFSGFGPDFVTMCLRRMYPTLMFLVLFTGILVFQGKQFRSLYEKIKNEKYVL